MKTKLTLRLDDRLIRNAKRHSAKSGKSVSKLVAEYFALIDSDEDIPALRSRLACVLSSVRSRARP